MHTPDFETFVSLARLGDLVPVRRELLFDTDTAVTAYSKLRRPPFGFLLESVVGGETWARYTFLGTAPREAWRLDAGPIGEPPAVRRWTPAGGWSEPEPTDDPLDALETLISARRPVHVPGLPRFYGGAVGYLGYDVVRHIERLPGAPEDDLGLPDALFMFTDIVLAIDNLFGRAHAIALVDVANAADRNDLRVRYDAAVDRLDGTVRGLLFATAPAPLALGPDAVEPDWRSRTSRARFEADVERVREYIAAGDVFQVVLSQRLSVEL
ncbi:MAG: anthranilate synthase component I, partial [Longimicrobiales bacterium]